MYIIIETFGGAAYAIVAMDEEGNNLTFDLWEEAVEAAKDYQEPIIYEVNR